MRRVQDWELRLSEAVSKHAALPFSWGGSDCFLFPADVVLALTGDDLAADVRDYDDPLSARAVLKRAGVDDMAEAFAAHFEEIHPAKSGRGDIGTTIVSGRVTGLVVLGAQIAAKAQQGVVILPRKAIHRAFKV